MTTSLLATLKGTHYMSGNRYFINAYQHDENFRWIYIHTPNSINTEDEIELYHEFTRFLDVVSNKDSYLEMSQAQYETLAELIVNDVGEEESTEKYNEKADEIIHQLMNEKKS